MSECIFCKIANGEIPSATIYEDEDFRVILDLSPASKGHALILPKEHYANLFELDDEKAGKELEAAKKVITKMKEILNCDGYNLVPLAQFEDLLKENHFHLHLIPRYEGDNVGLQWNPGTLTEEVKEEILLKFQ